MRIVLDTNLLISSILTPDGKPATILNDILAGTFTLVISSEIIEEVNKVLQYPKLAKLLKKKGVYPEKIEALLHKLTVIGIITPGSLKLDVIQADPADNMILACAIEGEADFVISGDHHLTQLKAYQGIRIIDPAAFLKICAEGEKA